MTQYRPAMLVLFLALLPLAHAACSSPLKGVDWFNTDHQSSTKATSCVAACIQTRTFQVGTLVYIKCSGWRWAGGASGDWPADAPRERPFTAAREYRWRALGTPSAAACATPSPTARPVGLNLCPALPVVQVLARACRRIEGRVNVDVHPRPTCAESQYASSICNMARGCSTPSFPLNPRRPLRSRRSRSRAI